MKTILQINGTEKEIADFILPTMGLSSARENMDKHEFRIEIDANEVFSLLSDDYEQWVIESKADDELCGSPQDELAEAGYPTLYNVLSDKVLLDLVVGGYLFDVLMRRLIPSNGNSIYWYDQVTDCSFVDEKVILVGVCYSKR